MSRERALKIIEVIRKASKQAVDMHKKSEIRVAAETIDGLAESCIEGKVDKFGWALRGLADGARGLELKDVPQEYIEVYRKAYSLGLDCRD